MPTSTSTPCCTRPPAGPGASRSRRRLSRATAGSRRRRRRRGGESSCAGRPGGPSREVRASYEGGCLSAGPGRPARRRRAGPGQDRPGDRGRPAGGRDGHRFAPGDRGPGRPAVRPSAIARRLPLSLIGRRYGGSLSRDGATSRARPRSGVASRAGRDGSTRSGLIRAISQAGSFVRLATSARRPKRSVSYGLNRP